MKRSLSNFDTLKGGTPVEKLGESNARTKSRPESTASGYPTGIRTKSGKARLLGSVGRVVWT
jgi:hypothetical protein